MDFTGAPEIALDGWTFRLRRGLPSTFTSECARAGTVEEFDMKSADGDFCFLSAQKVGADWADLIVVQRFAPDVGGFDPGIAFLPETAILFIGAGRRILAYDLSGPTRMWEDDAEMGFWSWHVYPSVVLMSAELEFAAWDRTGRKLWTRFAEPPWTFKVIDGTVQLDIMGTETEFPLLTGPS